MDTLRLRFAHPDVADLPLGAGEHGVGRAAADGELRPTEEAPAVCFCVDHRGVWLRVAEGTIGVHVNGRQVLRMAMLRVGDAVFVDGVGMRLVSGRPVPLPSAALLAAPVPAQGDPRVLIRGVGGHHHGRSFPLDGPLLVGSAVESDIRIDEPAFSGRHARFELHDGEVLLRDLGSPEGSEVNGEPVRDALLQPGDQVVFDAHHRFVLEAPARAEHVPPSDALDDDGHDHFDDDAGDTPAPRPSAKRWPWLLFAAVVLAALLALLLLFGAA